MVSKVPQNCIYFMEYCSSRDWALCEEKAIIAA